MKPHAYQISGYCDADRRRHMVLPLGTLTKPEAQERFRNYVGNTRTKARNRSAWTYWLERVVSVQGLEGRGI